ncbi:Cthe_2314 family HEPN domain-containing protein [Mammaliicoccus lentus]|uniref:Cthe_2314 family HEPN domain-containing protein n=1 Tax=Mammaliicoccus lentus TaxID=42858 RepID=UPI0007D9A1FF|nr:Cthe_2314 family HEPN domain-containing protein [Mammaliicoccus lentus]OAO24892.1 hypothetical protein AXY34_02935 [Mammaliicoccus lentus]
MKPFYINDNYFEYEYDKLLQEINIFDFAKFNDLIVGSDRLGSNLVAVINSIHDICEYFCNSFVSLKYSIELVESIEEEERNYYWVFYFHNITLHLLHTLDDLLYTLVQEYTALYEVKKDIGFRKSLIETLQSSNNKTYQKLGSILNKDVPVRTMKYRDEYTHNIMPYRLNSHPTVQNDITSFKGYSTMITNLDDLIGDINSDLKKIKKRAKKIKKAVGLIDN